MPTSPDHPPRPGPSGATTPRLRALVASDAAGGVVLIVAAVVALTWASSPWGASYRSLWSTEVTVGVGEASITESLVHWVNDLGMALFFFVAGLEIKRELTSGHLRHLRTASLPIVCAVGGMVVPALLYVAVTAGGDGADGWGIPMATDIAFATGVLALVGRGLPPSLRVFLLALAIVDDMGAIVVIGVFYSDGVSLGWLAVAVGTVVAVGAMVRARVRAPLLYGALALGLWVATYESGVHPTIAGAVLGLLTPARPWPTGGGRPPADEPDEGPLVDATSMDAEPPSAASHLQRRLQPLATFVVLPLFALANAGIDLTPVAGGASLTSPVAIGVLLGLVVGKPVGIGLAAVAATRLGRIPLPTDVTWTGLLGVGMLAGIGFTVSLFVTGLAFEGDAATDATLAILVASVLAGVAGAATLASARRGTAAADPR